MMDESGYIPSAAAHGEGELPEDAVLSDAVPCVRYKGTSNHRVLSRGDLDGTAPGQGEKLMWVPGHEIPWSVWKEYAGSPERALEVFRANASEFDLVGPGADEILEGDSGDEEFSIGGLVG